jgi:predicted DNA-binding antitoxin AbrB/MazE fold protein
MSQIIHATFEDGVLKPDIPLAYPPMTRVRLIVEPLATEESRPSEDAVMNEVERIWDEIDINSGRPRPSRDELHDRY